MIRTKHLIALLGAAALGGCASNAAFDNPFDQYTQRSATITPGAGNAKEANAATHVIDPWPRYVYDTRIPGDGQRAADAAERYKDVSKLPRAPRPITSNTSIGPSTGGGGVTP